MICAHLSVYGPFPDFDEMLEDRGDLWNKVVNGERVKWPWWSKFDLLMLAGDVLDMIIPYDPDEDEDETA